MPEDTKQVDYNKFFTGAMDSQAKRFKGSYIVWKKGEYFCIGRVGEKRGKMLITEKFERVYMINAYIPDEKIMHVLALIWPKWDELLGYKRLTKEQLLEILSKAQVDEHGNLV